jgi:hypothetical protein
MHAHLGHFLSLSVPLFYLYLNNLLTLKHKYVFSTTLSVKNGSAKCVSTLPLFLLKNVADAAVYNLASHLSEVSEKWAF